MVTNFYQDKSDVLVVLRDWFEDLLNCTPDLIWTVSEYDWFIYFINAARTVGTNHGFHTSAFAEVLIEYRENINSLIGSNWFHSTEFNQVLSDELLKSIKNVQFTLAQIQVD